MTSDDGTAVRIGLLYPTKDCGEDDFVALAGLLDPTITVGFGYVPWGEAVNDLADLDAAGKRDAVRELGEPERLDHAVAELSTFAPDVLSWACTSCSFLWGLDGASRQAEGLAGRSGIPASSTSLAFVSAARALGLTRVGIGSVYGDEVTSGFIEFLAAAGITTVHHVARDAPSDRALARWDEDRILQLVADGDSDSADAVLVPETALHTTGLVQRAEQLVGKPVLTATQVTLWDALRLVGWRERRDDLGALFRRLPPPLVGGSRRVRRPSGSGDRRGTGR